MNCLPFKNISFSYYQNSKKSNNFNSKNDEITKISDVVIIYYLIY
jgi:hypothetical protein